MSLPLPKYKNFISVASEFLFSNIFSETTGPIKAKFHVEPPLDGWMEVCSNGIGNMTKISAMPIYGKKP